MACTLRVECVASAAAVRCDRITTLPFPRDPRTWGMSTPASGGCLSSLARALCSWETVGVAPSRMTACGVEGSLSAATVWPFAIIHSSMLMRGLPGVWPAGVRPARASRSLRRRIASNASFSSWWLASSCSRSDSPPRPCNHGDEPSVVPCRRWLSPSCTDPGDASFRRRSVGATAASVSRARRSASNAAASASTADLERCRRRSSASVIVDQGTDP